MGTKVRTEITIEEVGGTTVDSNAKNRPVLIIESHWVAQAMGQTLVVLTIDGKRYSVVGAQVQAGVTNAMNRGGG